MRQKIVDRYWNKTHNLQCVLALIVLHYRKVLIILK